MKHCAPQTICSRFGLFSHPSSSLSLSLVESSISGICHFPFSSAVAQSQIATIHTLTAASPLSPLLSSPLLRVDTAAYLSGEVVGVLLDLRAPSVSYYYAHKASEVPYLIGSTGLEKDKAWVFCSCLGGGHASILLTAPRVEFKLNLP